MRSFAIILYLLWGLPVLLLANVSMTDTSRIEADRGQQIITGYHLGVVQPLMMIHQHETTYLTQNSFYTIGFPIGLTFRTGGRVLFDLELVPFVTPFIMTEDPIRVHILYHPGLLIPLGEGFTAGIRLAYESGIDQLGATLLLNKAWNLNGSAAFFTEFVMPGRYGPDKKSGYTQIVALHVGIAFR